MAEAARKNAERDTSGWRANPTLPDNEGLAHTIASLVAKTTHRNAYEPTYHILDYGFRDTDAAGKQAILEWSLNPNASMENMPPGAMRYELAAGVLPGLGDLQALRDVYRDFKHGTLSGMTALDAVSVVPGVVGAAAGLASTRRLGDITKMGSAYRTGDAAAQAAKIKVKIPPKVRKEMEFLEVETFDPGSSTPAKAGFIEALEKGGATVELTPDEANQYIMSLRNSIDIWADKMSSLDPDYNAVLRGLTRSAENQIKKMETTLALPENVAARVGAHRAAVAELGGDAAEIDRYRRRHHLTGAQYDELANPQLAYKVPFDDLLNGAAATRVKTKDLIPEGQQALWVLPDGDIVKLDAGHGAGGYTEWFDKGAVRVAAHNAAVGAEARGPMTAAQRGTLAGIGKQLGADNIPVDFTDNTGAILQSVEGTPARLSRVLEQVSMDPALPGAPRAREDAIINALLEGETGEIPDPITGKPIRLAEERAQRYKTATADVDWSETEFANVTDMLEKLPPGRALASMAVAGESARHWYRNSSLALSQMFGAEAPRFTSMLAAMSPRTSVEQDFTGALLFWEKWNGAQRPSDPEVIREMLEDVIKGRTVGGEKAGIMPSTAANNVTRSAMFDDIARVLGSEDPVIEYLSGNKVNAFYNNLLQDLDKVTVDTWSSRYLGIGNLSGNDRKLKLDQLATPEYRHMNDPRLQGTPLANPDPARQGIDDGAGGILSRSQKYEAASMTHREAADLLTRMTGRKWEPAEVQETAWSFLKTMQDHPNRKGRDLIDFWKSGEWTEADIGAAASFDQSVFDPKNAPIVQRLVDQGLVNAPEPLAGRPRGGTTDRSLARQGDMELMLRTAQDTYGDTPKYLLPSLLAMATGRYGAGLLGEQKPAEPQGQGGLMGSF
jgi:hypothetical protein